MYKNKINFSIRIMPQIKKKQEQQIYYWTYKNKIQKNYPTSCNWLNIKTDFNILSNNKKSCFSFFFYIIYIGIIICLNSRYCKENKKQKNYAGYKNFGCYSFKNKTA